MKAASSWSHGLRPLWQQLAQRIPSQCVVCREWDRHTVCGTCISRFTASRTRCVQCACVVSDGVTRCGSCLLHPPHFDSSCAAVDYAFPWDTLVLRLKFHAGLDLLPALVQCMLQAQAVQTAPPTMGLVLPVPLSPQRLRERGFNQAWELARRLASQLGCQAQAQLLLRVRDTPAQMSLNKAERESAVRHAFAVDPLRRRQIAGQHITVVDDVMTTMATANEVARTLKQAGAKTVHLWCLARTA
jgi:ComF family protein